MPQVEIYTFPSCPYCQKAKALLKAKKIDFEETDVYTDPALRDAMAVRAKGRRTVPQIFINGVHVGGCDDLHALDAAGKLDPMLKDAE